VSGRGSFAVDVAGPGVAGPARRDAASRAPGRDAADRDPGNGWRFYYFDYYSGTSKAFDETAFPEYYGNSADAIAERPTINNAPSNLSNFETLQFESSQADGFSFETYSGSEGGQRKGVHMVNPSDGTELATPSSINNGGDFTVTQNSCN
jgi:hypothetical protein